jgi:hypothetical protein
MAPSAAVPRLFVRRGAGLAARSRRLSPLSTGRMWVHRRRQIAGAIGRSPRSSGLGVADPAPRPAAGKSYASANRRTGRGRDPLADGTPPCVSGTAARAPDLNAEQQLPSLSGQAPPSHRTNVRATNQSDSARTLLGSPRARRHVACGTDGSGTAARPRPPIGRLPAACGCSRRRPARCAGC